MENLWGDEIAPAKTKKPVQPAKPPTRAMEGHCRYYGHAWEVIGMSFEKQCTTCHAKSYCPGCCLKPPLNALVMYCEKHKPPTE